MTSTDPDWAALFKKHREAMYRVAARVLREGGILSQVEDVVQDAMMSLMSKPPKDVKNWEAMMVTAAKRRALDRLGSAVYRHSGPEFTERLDRPTEENLIADAEEALDREEAAARARGALAILDDRHRYVVWEMAKGRLRAEIAGDLGVTPARVSQMAARALEQLREELDR